MRTMDSCLSVVARGRIAVSKDGVFVLLGLVCIAVIVLFIVWIISAIRSYEIRMQYEMHFKRNNEDDD